MSKLHLRNDTYYLRYKENEKLRWRSLKTKSKKTANAKRKQIDAVLAGRFLIPQQRTPDLTLDDLANRYATWATNRRNKTTIENRLRTLKAFRNSTNITTLSDIQPEHAYSFQDHLVAKGLKHRSINDNIGALSH